jgi:signal transduction histidine kinase
LGEAPKVSGFHELLSSVRERFPDDRERIRIEIDANAPPSCIIPLRAAIEAISALVKNALDASADNQPVILQARSDSGHVVFRIRDQGSGMTPLRRKNRYAISNSGH